MSITRGPRNAADGTVPPAVVAAAAATASPVVAASPARTARAVDELSGLGDHNNGKAQR